MSLKQNQKPHMENRLVAYGRYFEGVRKKKGIFKDTHFLQFSFPVGITLMFEYREVDGHTVVCCERRHNGLKI